MKFSHADYMGEQVEKMLAQVQIDSHVKVIADLAGCSPSLVYQWNACADNAKAKYILALISQLAERGDYRWINMLLPVGDSVVRADGRPVPPNGSCDDEVADGAQALSQARLAHKGRNPDQIAEARASLREVEKRLELEEVQLRAQQGGA